MTVLIASSLLLLYLAVLVFAAVRNVDKLR